jgi:hypothetical protein
VTGRIAKKSAQLCPDIAYYGALLKMFLTDETTGKN